LSPTETMKKKKGRDLRVTGVGVALGNKAPVRLIIGKPRSVHEKRKFENRGGEGKKGQGISLSRNY